MNQGVSVVSNSSSGISFNTGTQSKQRKEVSRLTRLANNMTSDVILWQDRYYALGDGGKQGFFKTGT